MFKFFKKLKYYIKNKQRGMTLIELLVVLAIFALVTGLVMYDYGSFKSSTSTQNLANDIALSIRKAQSYAIGVRGTGTNFNYGHGIHFSTNPDGSNKSFILFSDINGDYLYTDIGSCTNPINNECQEILTINGADKISGFYLDNDLKNKKMGILDIVFKRPNPDANFCFILEGVVSCNTNLSSITIEVSNGRTGEEKITRSITIWNTGQIGVD